MHNAASRHVNLDFWRSTGSCHTCSTPWRLESTYVLSMSRLLRVSYLMQIWRTVTTNKTLILCLPQTSLSLKVTSCSSNRAPYFSCAFFCVYLLLDMPPLKSPRLEPESDSQAGTSSCEIDSFDIGSYIKVKDISNSAKFRLLTSHFKPGPTYSFPRFATGRKFQHKWLHQFQPWLVYSEVAKGGFCLPFALFATAYQGADLGTLVSRPLINLSKALEIPKKKVPFDSNNKM